MLCIGRKVGEYIVIGDNIRIKVLNIDFRGQVRLGIEAPSEIQVWREEIAPKVSPRSA